MVTGRGHTSLQESQSDLFELSEELLEKSQQLKKLANAAASSSSTRSWTGSLNECRTSSRLSAVVPLSHAGQGYDTSPPRLPPPLDPSVSLQRNQQEGECCGNW